LFERFNIEALATTESPLDDLAHHTSIRKSGWARARDHGLSTRSGGRSRHASVSSTTQEDSAPITGEDRMSWRGYLAAHRKRRAFFAVMGATSTDTAIPPRAPPT
jgi:glucuronate isomerase